MQYIYLLMLIWLAVLVHSAYRPLALTLPEMYQTVRDVQLRLCGDLCDVKRNLMDWPDKPWDFSVRALQERYRSADVDCPRLFSIEAEQVFDGPPIEPVPPVVLPLKDDFTLGGRVKLEQMYMQNLYLESTGHSDNWSKDWKSEKIIQQVERLRKREMHGTYGKGVTNFFADILRLPKLDLRNKDVLVIGSEKPWVEIALLLGGAANVTTLDYGQIQTDHPQLRTMTPKEFNQQYRDGLLPKFDMAVSFSSIEHSGLGRYGDRLNPWGDLITMAKVHCALKEEGTLLIGVPSAQMDLLYNNAHRTYGLLRWPLLLTNWYPLDAWREKEGYWQNGIVYAIKSDLQDSYHFG